MAQGDTVSTGTTYGDYGQDETSVLVRSLALSTAKLWEELFERMDRLEVAHRELRALVTRIERALPDGSDELRTALGQAGRATREERAREVGTSSAATCERAPVERAPVERAPVERAPVERAERGPAAPTVPPVWTPAPLALAQQGHAGPWAPSSPPTEELPLVGPAMAAAVPPPPAGYVAFRAPSPPTGSSGARTGPAPSHTAVEQHVTMRVIGGPLHAAPASLAALEDGDAGPAPPIAPDFFVRTGRRRH